MTAGELREQWHPGDRAIFTYSLGFDESSEICAALYHRSGSIVTVAGEAEHDGNREDFPTMQERGDAGVPVAYRIRFGDGVWETAFEDELTTIQEEQKGAER